MNKIVIWGPPASGKTTLAKKLGRFLGIKNIIKTDDFLFDSNWKIVEKNKFIEKVSPLLVKDSWIVEGNLGEYYTREEILDLSDLVIILNPARLILKYRIWKRSFFRWIDNLKGKRMKPSKADPPVGLIKNIKDSSLMLRNFKNYYFVNLLNSIEIKKLHQKVKIISNQSELQLLLKQL